MKNMNLILKINFFSLSVNEGIPAPILDFTDGDGAETTVYKKLGNIKNRFIGM